MAMLKFRTINLNHCAGILHRELGGRFHDAGLARTGWSKEQDVSNRTPGSGHAREIQLIYIDDLFDRFVLPNDKLSEVRI